jgi:hypothetical protein
LVARDDVIPRLHVSHPFADALDDSVSIHGSKLISARSCLGLAIHERRWNGADL